MDTVYVHTDNPQKRIILKIIETLNNNGIVLLPADTSYLLAIKIGSKIALEKLNRLKKNKKKKFYSVAFKDMSHISQYTDISDQQFNLLKRILPGPYTFIMKASKEIPKIMLQKRKEIGIRIPDTSFMQKLLDEYGAPIIVSTANAQNNEEFFEDPEYHEPEWLHYVDLLVDGGYLPSDLTTIIHLEENEFEIIRTGQGSVDKI